ncbi:MAG: apolipoprotein N-acyltransferase [Sandaracinus sp.]|nr:apolipoprotein N-acyltransferase [Sandaracinus sp.]MCB9617076.1 apolipoprotein N-acyltransferase [Sandaracinus sp.]MCB9635021.1 apolipoprotein N-acyltransferase [Sandaracinus sp.]
MDAARWAAVSAVSGAVLAWAAPPEPTWWLVFVAFWPLAVAARVLAGTRVAFGVGWLAGFVFAWVGFVWFPDTVVRFHDASPGLAWTLHGLHAAWIGVPWGLALGLAGYVRRGVGLPLAWVATVGPWPQLFPHTFALGLVQEPAWMQSAELGGVVAVEAVVVLVSSLLAAAWLERRWRPLGLALAVLGIVWVGGSHRMGTLAEEAVVSVGVAQPNGPARIRSARDAIERLQAATERAVDAGAAWIVWPEAGAYPFPMRRPWRPLARRGLRALQRDHTRPIVFGVASHREGRAFNTAAVVGPSGRMEGSSDKNVLFPFGEYVPWVSGETARRWFPSLPIHEPGREVHALPVRLGTRTLRVGPLVCYEDLFAAHARRVAAVPGGIDVFVSLTIDTWFATSVAPERHEAMARFRAVEHRVPVVRAVAAGPSSVIDAAGRVVARTAWREGGRVEAETLVVPTTLGRGTSQPTFFARFGHRFPELGWACLLALGWRARRSSRRV